MFEEHAMTLNNASRGFCFEYRIGVEGEAAAAAARYRQRSDLLKLRESMEYLEELHEASEISSEVDFEFHLLVAKATQNAFFVSSLDTLRSTISEGMLLAIAPTALDRKAKNAAIREQHRAVFDAIVDKDESRAREAMRAHLSRCRKSTRHWDEALAAC